MFDEMFKRSSLQQLREFLLHGTECGAISEKSCEQRLKEAGKAVFSMIRKKFPDMEEQEKLTGELYSYVGTVENVYMEIGLQCGMLLAVQLFKGMLEI